MGNLISLMWQCEILLLATHRTYLRKAYVFSSDVVTSISCKCLTLLEIRSRDFQNLLRQWP